MSIPIAPSHPNSGFQVAHLTAMSSYNHAILNILAADFDVSYERISLIPTLMQAGYAAGLLFLCPLGDLFPRRPFVLLLIFCTATIVSRICNSYS